MLTRLIRAPRAALLAAGALAALSCGREVTSPDGGRFVARGFSFVTTFPGGAPTSNLIGDLVPFTKVRVQLRNSAGDLALNRVVDFPSDATEVELSLTVPLASSTPEVMALSLAYANAAGDTVFRAGPVDVTLAPARRGEPPPQPVEVEAEYTGPGAQATRVDISVGADTVVSGDAFSFTATAFDGQMTPVGDVPIGWRSLTPALATVTAVASGSGVTLAGRGVARIEAFLPTGATDTVMIEVLPRAATLEIASGNNQVAPAGATLPLPVVARVRATDNLPMAGVAVTFVPGAGASVGQATVITDANGLASTTWTLGTTPPGQSLTVSVNGLAGSPLTFSALIDVPVLTLLHHFQFTDNLTATVGQGGGTLFEGANVANGVLTLDGVDDYVQLNGQLVPTDGSFSLSFFVRNQTPVSQAAAFVSQGPASGGSLYVGQNNAGRWQVHDGMSASSPTPANDGLFHHVVLTVDRAAGQYELWVDGSAIEVGAALAYSSGGSNLRLGRAAESLGSFFAGQIDELRIYEGVIPPATITTLYAAGVTAPDRLVFTQQPSNAIVGNVIAPIICVGTQDLLGRSVPFGGSISLSLGANPGGATLGGTTTVSAITGVACFTDITVSNAASGYTLVASASGLTSATSTSFDVAEGAATSLTFTGQPQSTLANAAIAPAVVVEARTGSGALASTFTGPVTLAFGTNPTGATLGGTLTVNAVGGVATFSDLSVNNAGTGYTLTASSSGLANATSAAFDIASAGLRNSWTNASGGNWSVASNWSLARVPNATDTVAIDLAGTYAVTLDVNFSGNIILLGGASGTQTLTAVSRTVSLTQGLRIATNGVYSIQGGSVGGAGALRAEGWLVALGSATISAPLQLPNGGNVEVRSSSVGSSVNLTVSNGFTNDGTIALTALNAGYTTTLTVTNGTLVNGAGGVIRTVVGSGGSRVLAAELDNGGTLDLLHPLSLERSGAQHVNRSTIALSAANLSVSQLGTTPSFTNLGSITMAAGRTLSVTNGSVNLSGGTVSGDSLGTLSLSNVTLTATPASLRSRVNFGLGTTLSAPFTIPVGDSLRVTGGTLLGPGLHVAGRLVALGSTGISTPVTTDSVGVLEVRSSAMFSSTTLTVANGFTNTGTILMTTLNAGYTSSFRVTTGTLVNAPSGVIRTLAGAGGSRLLEAQLDNSGTLDLRYAMSVDRPSSQHVHRSAMALDSANLTITQSGTTPSFTNLGSIALGASRALIVNGGSLNLSGGTFTGDTLATLSLSGVSLTMTPASMRTRVNFGTGTSFTSAYTIPAGDSLRVSGGTLAGPGLQVSGRLVALASMTVAAPLTTDSVGSIEVRSSALFSSAALTVSNGFTNNGTIELIALNAGYSSTFAVPNGTLVNASSGVIRSLVGASGARVLAAQLDNNGTLDIQHPMEIDRASAQHVHRSSLVLGSANLTVTQTGTTPSFTNLGSVQLGSSRTMTVSGGSLDLSGGTLTGDTLSTLVLSGVSLSMTPASMRTRLNFGAGSSFTAPFTIPAGDSLRVIGGTLAGPGLQVLGRLIALGSMSITAPVTTDSAGAMEVRSSALGSSVNLSVANGFTNLGLIELLAYNAAYTSTFTVTNGTLVNAPSGVIRTQVGAGGGRTLAAQLDNSGTLDLLHPMEIARAASQHVHRSALTLGPANLTVTQTGGSPSFTNLGSIQLGQNRSLVVTGGSLDLSGGTLTGDTLSTLSLSNVTLSTTPAAMRTRVNFGTGSTFAAPFTIPVGDSLRVTGGTLAGPGLQVSGRLIALGSMTVAAPVTTDPLGAMEVRSSALGSSVNLSVTNGFTNAGLIELIAYNAGYTSTFTVTNGTLVNAATGVIRTLVGALGGRTLAAQLDNSGTLDIQQALQLDRASAQHVHRSALTLGAANLTVVQTGTTPSFTNLGSINLATGRTMTVNGGSADFTGGTFTGDSLATLALNNVSLGIDAASVRTRIAFGSGTTLTSAYTIPAGDSLRIASGTLNAPGLDIAGRLIAVGSSSIAAPVTTQATGAIVVRPSSLFSNSTLTITNGFTNNGVIELVALDVGYTSTLAVTNGTLVNAGSGTIRTSVGAGGSRVLAAQLDNSGTLDLLHPLEIARGSSQHVHRSSLTLNAANLTVTQTGTTPSFTNLGSIQLGSGRTFSISGGSLDLSGGTLIGDTLSTLGLSGVSLTMTPASMRTRVNFGTGSSFTAPYSIPTGDSLRVLGGTLAGPGLEVQGRLIALAGVTVSAPITTTAGSAIEVRSSAIGSSTTMTVSNGFTNNGTIELTSYNAGYTTGLTVLNGTLVNASGGVIRSLAGSAGGRNLGAQLDNQGLLDVQHSMSLNRTSSVNVNSGSIAVASGAALTLAQSGTLPSFTNLGSITLSGTGTQLTVNGGSFVNTLGTLDGSGSLAFTGTTSTDLALPALNVPVNFGSATTLANPLVIPVGDTLFSVGGTIAGPGLSVNGALLINAATTISAPLTTGSASLIDIRANALTVPQPLTVNGILRLIAPTASFTPTLTMTGQTLTIAATGSIETPFGAGMTRVINVGTLDNSGNFNVATNTSLGTAMLQQRNLLSIDASRTLSVGTLNLLPGSSTTVTGTLTATSCSNTGGSIGGSGSIPAACQ